MVPARAAAVLLHLDQTAPEAIFELPLLLSPVFACTGGK
jgi:hypothetical protein